MTRERVEPGIWRRGEVFEITWRDAQAKQRRKTVQGGRGLRTPQIARVSWAGERANPRPASRGRLEAAVQRIIDDPSAKAFGRLRAVNQLAAIRAERRARVQAEVDAEVNEVFARARRAHADRALGWLQEHHLQQADRADAPLPSGRQEAAPALAARPWLRPKPGF
jgi:hypothetical protein